MVKTSFIPFFEEEVKSVIPDRIPFYTGIKDNMTPLYGVKIFGDVQAHSRLNIIGQTMFTYTPSRLENFRSFNRLDKTSNCVAVVPCFSGDLFLRFIALMFSRGVTKLSKHVIWLDLHRPPKNEQERAWLDKAVPFSDIVITGSEHLRKWCEKVAYPHLENEVFFYTLETPITDTNYSEVKSVFEFEKRAKNPIVSWTGDIDDVESLLPFLEHGEYPLKTTIRDNIIVEHPKLELIKTHWKRTMRRSDFTLITQDPVDPHARTLIKQALLRGVIPLVWTKENIGDDLEPYIIRIPEPSMLNKEWLSGILFYEPTKIEKMLIEGQVYVYENFSPVESLESLIELYKASEILLTRKKKKETDTND